MFNFENYKVQERNYNKEFSNTDRFTQKNDFMVAAALVDGSQKNIKIPEDVGSFKFYRKTWKTEDGLNFKEIETRPCSRDDFNWGNYSFSDQKSLFYQAGDSLEELESTWSEYICIVDPNELYTSGNYNEAQFE